MIPQKPLEYITSTGLMARDHRKVQPGSVFFVCSKDMPVEEALFFLEQARLAGAIYSLVDCELYNRLLGKFDLDFLVPVDNATLCWSYLAKLLYPSQLENAVAITGTSGKTTVSWLYSQMIAQLKGECLYIGTLGAYNLYADGAKNKIADSLTTPDALDLSEILSNNKGYGCLEASSHGLDQDRLAYLKFTAGCFINLSLDHLDYHRSMTNYFKAKKKLFDLTDKAVINQDGKYGKLLIKDLPQHKIITYGSQGKGDLQLIRVHPGKNVTLKYQNNYYDFPLSLLGKFNCENFTAAVALLLMNDFKIEDIQAISENLTLPRGRLTKISNKPEIYIDYAHKPDALEKVLKALQEYKNFNNKGALWLVFGCGGSRDMTKRVVMGSIAARYADKIIVTDDNPRHEMAYEIRSTIIRGIVNESNEAIYYNIENRRTAIEFVIMEAESNDMILIAGKGHETYQQIQDKKYRFSDINCAKAAVRRRHKKAHRAITKLKKNNP
jgi:UDP-N-acetylmuramoyl-L-alanyl-D-glutamate--2,6-diaminopimelate ligase